MFLNSNIFGERRLIKRMYQEEMFVVLSGPSCVGKGPLHNALRKFYPDTERRLRKLTLYNSRSPRPGEQEGIDYYFRTREEIESLRDQEGYLVLDVRGDLQALATRDLESVLQAGLNPFFEGNPFVPTELWKHPSISAIPRISVFLSPLSREEILYLKQSSRGISLPEFITDVMRRKLLRRTQRQKGILSLQDLNNIEARAQSAYREMQLAWQFDYVIPNHDGEDSENWEQFYYPLADARKALLSFAAILNGQTPVNAEKWEPDLL